MGLQKIKGSDNWYVEFEMKGVRVRQSTGTTDKVEAAAIDTKLREETKARLTGNFTKMTLREAFRREGELIGQKTSKAAKTNFKTCVRIFGDAFGLETYLDDITDLMINGWSEKALIRRRCLCASHARPSRY
jgi:hypothetical protein